jgi:hypothetical protein
MLRLRLAATALATIALLVSACSAGKPIPSASPVPVTSARPVSQPTRETADLLVLRRLDRGNSGGYAIVNGGNGDVAFALPEGGASRGFRLIATAHTDGSRTTVQFLTAEGGEVQRETHVDGSWKVPTVGLVHRPTGMSADGGTVVLEQEGTDTGIKTTFAVVKASGSRARTIALDGDFSFDALSPDGAWLYLIGHGTGDTYHVRRVDVATAMLDPTVIVDKRSTEEVMSGYAITQLAAPDGWVYTLYQGADGPFVHALNTLEGQAFCIDLPESGAAAETDATAASWGLALAHNGRSLFAANGALGTVSELSLQELSVMRTAHLTKETGMAELVKFESSQWNDAGAAAVSPDGSVLYVAGPHGISAIDTPDLGVIGALGGDRGYRSLAVGAAGMVYAVDSSGGLSRLGTTDKREEAVLAGDGYAVIEGVISLR